MNSPAIDVVLTVRRAYDQARAGDLHGAGTLCGDVLHADPFNPEAWLLRAVIAIRTGNPGEALIAARRALPVHPARAAIHALIGDALRQLQRPLEALESYRSALQIEPDLASAQFGQATALIALERHREALTSLDELLRRHPEDFEALMLRGRTQFQLKELIEALASYERASALEPRNADAHCNRGAVLLMLLRIDEALASFDTALSLMPVLAEAHYHRGQALRMRDEPQEALLCLECALAARPDFVDALIGRGEVLRELRRPTEALQSFERARALDPASEPAQRGLGDALLDLGRPVEAVAAQEAALRLGTQRAQTLISHGDALRALGRYAAAVASYDESLQLDPRNATAFCDRAHTLLLWTDRGSDRVAEALACYTQALEINPDIPIVPGTLAYQQMCQGDWSVRAPAASPAQILRAVRAGVPACAPFAFLSISDDAATQLQCARAFTRHQLGASLRERPRPRYGHGRVRIAYISADLRAHAVSYLLAGVFEQHDRARFEVTAIALRPPEESVTGTRVRAAFDRFLDVSAMNDREIVDLVRGLEIDIAIDLTGYTKGFRPQLLAAGVAPIQVSYLGYPGTMGGSFIDYLIADDFVVPEERRTHYAEATAYLPECFQANDDRRVMAERRLTRAEQGLPEAALVLCCLNNSHKINRAMFDVWMRLLERMPHAVLWLLSHEREVQDHLRREAASRGIDPARLVFAERMPYPEHLARLGLADLFLDTLPFNAGTTASDALWAGVPVLTCAGDAYAARMAGSLLRAVGLPELITTSLSDYESLALRLAAEPALLAAWRARLAANRRSTPLFDTARFTAHLEAAYLEMWRRHERGEAPSTFAVSPISPAPAQADHRIGVSSSVTCT
jgi:predicted O-linked N-acetylglucosamine transferase (SPINDLY family)